MVGKMYILTPWTFLFKLAHSFFASQIAYMEGNHTIDPFTVSITILVGGQSWLKLLVQQMYGKLFNFQTL